MRSLRVGSFVEVVVVVAAVVVVVVVGVPSSLLREASLVAAEGTMGISPWRRE